MKQRGLSSMIWIDSYRNHVIYSSIYLGALAHFIPSASYSESNSACAINCLFLIVFAWALKAEIKYILLRIRLPPGESGWPILGHLPDMVCGKQMIKNTERVKKYGRIFTINIGMKPVVCFLDDDDVTWVQSQERMGNTRPIKMPVYSKLIGADSIMFSFGTHHKRLRRMMEPAFSPKSIKDYAKPLDDNIKEFLESWNQSGKYQTLDEVALLALQLFFVCAVGKVDRDLLETLNPLFEGWFNGFRAPLPIPYPGGKLSKAFECKEELQRVLGQVLRNFKRDNPAGSPGSTSTLLGRLCYETNEEGTTLTDNQLIETMLFLVFAGHDSTKATLGNMLHYLTEHPEVYDLLVEEAKGFKEPLDVEELKKAPLLNAFLAETWRIMCPLTAHVTAVTKDLYYKGYHIPKGAAVAFLMQNAHCDEGRFPQPSEFHISRWIPKEHPLHDPQWYAEGTYLNGSPIKYRAFGGGPHLCLGMHFAKLEARIVLARLVQKYVVQTKNSHLWLRSLFGT